MDAWVSVYDLLIDDGCDPELLITAINDEGIYKYSQQGRCHKVADFFVSDINQSLRNYADACLGSSYDDQCLRIDYEDPQRSPFNPYGWPQDRLPKLLRQTSISMHEERLRRAIELGFKPPSNFYGRLDGAVSIAKKMGLTRQNFSRSIRVALKARDQDRKNAAVLHNTSK